MQYISALGCVYTIQSTSDQVLYVVDVEVLFIVFEQNVSSLPAFFVGSIQDVVD